MNRFSDFCLSYELQLLSSPSIASSTNDRIDFIVTENKKTIVLPKLTSSALGLNIVVFSDGSSAYYPYFISPFGANIGYNNPTSDCIKFTLSRSDLFSNFI